MNEVGTRVRIARTGDSRIDQHASQGGQIEDTREVNDGGYCYTQVGIRAITGDLVWVNENEYEAEEAA